MVQSLFKVTDYLARQGHDVFVLSDIKHAGKTEAGVKWVHEPIGRFDVLVSNRGVANGYPELDVGARILWTHDLPHNGFIQEPKTVRAFAYTVFMSRYAERVWRTFYKDIGRSVLIPNGVDKELFYPREKDLRYLIYFFHPNRGLKRLSLIADAISSRLGERIKFHAYSNAKSMYPSETTDRDHDDQYDLPTYDEAGTLKLCAPLPSQGIAEQVGRAGLCILPSGYPEICSNSVLQALASGTPIITTGGMGATPEWVRHRRNGMLTQFQPMDYMVHTLEIVRNAVEVLENEKLHRKLIKGAARTKILSWDEVGRAWDRLISRCC